MKVTREFKYSFECDACGNSWSVIDPLIHYALMGDDIVTISCPYCKHSAQFDEDDVTEAD